MLLLMLQVMDALKHHLKKTVSKEIHSAIDKFVVPDDW
jgi:hypothetical protein